MSVIYSSSCVSLWAIQVPIRLVGGCCVLELLHTYFSATIDLWSSAGMRPYMSYTVHFVNEKWEMQSRCLQTHYFPENHIGQNMEAKNLLASNQVCLTTGSGSNMISARLSCFGHNLHLAVMKAFNDDTRCCRALEICCKIVRVSYQHSEKFEFGRLYIHRIQAAHYHNLATIESPSFTTPLVLWKQNRLQLFSLFYAKNSMVYKDRCLQIKLPIIRHSLLYSLHCSSNFYHAYSNIIGTWFPKFSQKT